MSDNWDRVTPEKIELRDALAELNPDALLADGFEEAFVGYVANHLNTPGRRHVAVYDLSACARVLAERDGMGADEAEEYLSFNVLGAYAGPDGPLFVETGRW